VATISNLYIDQGSDYSSIITVNNQNGTPLNLTGATVAAQFRKSYNSSSFTNFTVTIHNALLGQIRLVLAASVSSAVMAGRYLYDIETTSINGEKRRVLEGIVVLSPEITR
jgi:hypothetical protein